MTLMNRVFGFCVCVTCFVCHLMLILGVSYCPTMHQWESRAGVKCPDPSTYHCLLNEEDQHTEVCVKGVYVLKGKYPTITRNATIITRSCPADEYQPNGKLSTSYRKITCDFRKSTCDDAGETTCNDGSTISDRLCECDYRGGYRNFQTKRCYKKSTSSPCVYFPCGPGKVLNSDYRCVDECLFRLFRNNNCIADQTGTTPYRLKERSRGTLRIGQLMDENYTNHPRFPANTTPSSEYVTSVPERIILTIKGKRKSLVSTTSYSISSSLSESETDSTTTEHVQMTLIDSNEVLLVSLMVVSLVACNQRKKRLNLINQMTEKGPDVCLYPNAYQTVLPKGEDVAYQTVKLNEISHEVLSDVDFTERHHDLGNLRPSTVKLDVMDTEYVEMRNISPITDSSGRASGTPSQT
ncbi:uncharacterized protein LOC125651890 isoform X2 [Ostrea edulis]|uniref:uncharacterized protein LOC125651890 isoform X2 n=1 Tax=Ostrea edulis TaxID=37623 RepID=UPI0024AFA53A|nr:uncharacterized protein LOC125651890 isoform X2 [Ostrea edulis]